MNNSKSWYKIVMQYGRITAPLSPPFLSSHKFLLKPTQFVDEVRSLCKLPRPIPMTRRWTAARLWFLHLSLLPAHLPNPLSCLIFQQFDACVHGRSTPALETFPAAPVPRYRMFPSSLTKFPSSPRSPEARRALAVVQRSSEFCRRPPPSHPRQRLLTGDLTLGEILFLFFWPSDPDLMTLTDHLSE
jgi:hypothetical protein